MPYGEPGDDWLLLDQERIQAFADRTGNNQVIGLVQIDQPQTSNFVRTPPGELRSALDLGKLWRH